MFANYSTDYCQDTREENKPIQKQFELNSMIARDVTVDTSFPQESSNSTLPISVGGLAANLSLINIALFALQVNVSQGGDSQAISVNGVTQNQPETI